MMLPASVSPAFSSPAVPVAPPVGGLTGEPAAAFDPTGFDTAMEVAITGAEPADDPPAAAEPGVTPEPFLAAEWPGPRSTEGLAFLTFETTTSGPASTAIAGGADLVAPGRTVVVEEPGGGDAPASVPQIAEMVSGADAIAGAGVDRAGGTTDQPMNAAGAGVFAEAPRSGDEPWPAGAASLGPDTSNGAHTREGRLRGSGDTVRADRMHVEPSAAAARESAQAAAAPRAATGWSDEGVSIVAQRLAAAAPANAETAMPSATAAGPGGAPGRSAGEREPGQPGPRGGDAWQPASADGRAGHAPEQTPFEGLPARVSEPPAAERGSGDVTPRVVPGLPPPTDGAMRVGPSGGAETARPPGPDLDRAENISRLVQSLRVQIRNGISEATVRLRPEHLGEVTIAVRVDGRTVSATVHAESADVREWLQAQESVLRGSLSEHGLHLDRLHVQRDGRHDRHERPPADGRRPRGRREPHEEPRFEVIV